MTIELSENVIDAIADAVVKKMQKPKTGHWLKVDDEEPIAYDCSECGVMVSRRYRFCPDCGAKMD